MKISKVFDVARVFFEERRLAMARDEPEQFWADTLNIIDTIYEADGGNNLLLQELLIACFQALECYAGDGDKVKAAETRLRWAERLYKDTKSQQKV